MERKNSVIRKVVMALIVVQSVLPLFAQQWQMKKAPLMTPWSETMDVDNVLGEYPRPQLVREGWMNLNGIWDLRKGTKDEVYEPSKFVFDQKILVPFPIESALSGVMVESDVQCYWYKRSFAVPESMKGKRLLLHFEAVDWECVAYVNGTKVGRHTGGYDPFYFDITAALSSQSEQELVVYIYDNTGAEGQPKGKQALNKWGCWYTPVSGIWQTVWLEAVNTVYVTALQLQPDVDNASMKVKVETSNATDVTANIRITDAEGKMVSHLEGAKVNRLLILPIENPQLWSPEQPYLYDMAIEVYQNGVLLDAVTSYCGMRKIEVKKVGNTPRIFLNGKQIFQMGPLDQGWWPDGLYTAPSDEALLFDIKGMKALGFNMIRKHIKIEPARWYMHCDREGILVWQDLPSPNMTSGYEDFAKKNFEEEAIRIIEYFRNHPSIIQWIVFNEGWGQFDTERMTQVVENYVGQTLVCCASGWNDANVGDVKDSHSYPNPSCPLDLTRAAVCGEYGGITLKVPGHIWPGGDFQYTTVETGEDFTAFFNRLADQIKDYYSYGLNAAVYTQLSDVEIEKNGLYTYDRRILKPASPTGKLKAKIEECLQMPQTKVKVQTVLSTSKSHKYNWQYTTGTVPRHWFDTDFDDRSWKTGKAAFGKSSLWNTVDLISTSWTTSQIHMRRWFYLGEVSQELIKSLRFVLYHDDDIHLYINGVWAASKQGSVSNYIPYDISDEALMTLKPNSWNLLAVEGLQGSGEQIMDVGLSAFSETDFHYVELFDEREGAAYAEQATVDSVKVPLMKKLEKPVPNEPMANAIIKGQFYHLSDNSNVAWGDYDNDGRLEIAYSGKNVHMKTPAQQKVKALYHCQEDGTFFRLKSPFDLAYYACPTWLDFNNDGRLDLLLPGLTNMDYSNDLESVVTRMYENLGADESGTQLFREVNADWLLNNKGIRPLYNGMGGGRSRHWVSTGDYDNDGYIDLLMTGFDDYVDTTGELSEEGEPLVRHDRRAVYLYHNEQGQGFQLQQTPLNGMEPFLGLARGTVHFADMDNDGWLDVVSSGYGPGEGNLHIYWNRMDGTFTESDQTLLGSYDSSCELADMDMDGYLDVVVTGYARNKGAGSGKSFYIYRNRGNRYFEMKSDAFCGFEGVDGATPSIGDVNHDGKPDILVGGHGEKHEITTWLYLNRGDFSFQSCGAYYQDGSDFTFDRISHGNNHLVDYDNDGYLDAWNMGWAQSDVCSRSCATELWKNSSSEVGITANKAPTAPTGLTSRYDKASKRVTLTWQPATDDVTPVQALQYNVFVRKVGTPTCFMTVPADVTTGFVKVGELSGQVMGTSYSFLIDDEQASYEWGVQAIDNGKRGGPFATAPFRPLADQVEKVSPTLMVYSSTDGIHYQVEGEALLKVYKMAGSLCFAPYKVQGTGLLPDLEHGLYVVQILQEHTLYTYKVRY